MKKSIIFFLVASFSLLSFTNGAKYKVKIKKEVVYIDDVEYARWEKDPNFKQNRFLKNLNGDLLLDFITRSYKDPRVADQSNPDGNVVYWEVTDPKSKELYFEYGYSSKILFRGLYGMKVITEDGKIDETNLKEMASKYGKQFSANRP